MYTQEMTQYDTLVGKVSILRTLKNEMVEDVYVVVNTTPLTGPAHWVYYNDKKIIERILTMFKNVSKLNAS